MAETVSTIDRSSNLAANSLLSTKLFIPQARQLQDVLPRLRLVEQLQMGLTRKLTLISAPAGFGKTTLLTQWIPQSERCVSWLSLDEADNDLTRFLTYFIAALQTLKADFGQAFLVALQAPQLPPIESLITALINEIVQTLGEFALVLDDYHLIQLEAIHTAIAFLLNNLPPNMHLILASRADPPLPLARLRMRGQLTELRAADLRFTLAEATTFFQQIKDLPLLADQIEALETRTEGWIAGLQLAALSIRGHEDVAGFIQAFSGSHRHVLSYLVEEVLNQCPADTLDFLLQTSILGRLSAPLCDAVTGRSDSHQMLEKIEAANLFLIPLDDTGQWYRYHHLFAEMLQSRLQQTQPGLRPALHRRASEWHEQSGYLVEAINHALAAQAFDRAAMLVEQVAPAMIQYSELVRLLSWLEILPADEVQTRPLLGLYYGWSLFLSGQIQPAVAHLEAVEALLEADATKQTPEVQGHVAAMRAYLIRVTGDLAATITLSRQALTHLPEQDSLLRAMVTLNLAIAHYLQGEFEPASDLLTQTIATGQTAQRMANTLAAIYLNTQLLRGQGSLQQALQLCQDGLELVARHK
jgi:LuxR family maltose regulon positive regulatory protein